MILTKSVPAGTSAVTAYIPVPRACTILNAWSTVSGDPGADVTITLLSGSTTVGTITVADESTAGTVDTYVRDSTGGFTKFTAGSALKVTVSAPTSSAGFELVIELDEYARTHA